MIEIHIKIDEIEGISAEARVPKIEGFTQYEHMIAKKFLVLVTNCDPSLNVSRRIVYDRKPRDAK